MKSSTTIIWFFYRLWISFSRPFSHFSGSLIVDLAWFIFWRWYLWISFSWFELSIENIVSTLQSEDAKAPTRRVFSFANFSIVYSAASILVLRHSFSWWSSDIAVVDAIGIRKGWWGDNPNSLLVFYYRLLPGYIRSKWCNLEVAQIWQQDFIKYRRESSIFSPFQL